MLSVSTCLGWNSIDAYESSRERMTLWHISGRQVLYPPSPTLIRCWCTTVHQLDLGCRASASAAPPTHETCSPGWWAITLWCLPDSKRALNQRWINLRIFNQNMLNQRWDRASIQRQFAHTVHRRFNVEWEANDDGVSIPFQPLFNDYGRILVDSTAVCSYCSRSIQRWMEGGRRRRVDPFSTFIQLVIMVELWSMLVLHSLIYLKDIMIWLYN